MHMVGIINVFQQTSLSSSALKACPSRLQLARELDRATLKLVEQFRANQHKLAAKRALKLR